MITLRLILGDQLNINHSWFDEKHENVSYVMMEMRQETDYVKHHIQKIVAFFSAMRQFSDELKDKGFEVIYFNINDTENQQSLEKNIKGLIEKHGFEKFEYQLPDEYRLDEILSNLTRDINIKSEVYDSEHFLSKRNDLSDFFKGKKQFIMEYFYRDMRKKYDLLMEDGNPEGGKWNFDQKNRNKWKNETPIPNISLQVTNVSSILKEIQEAEIKTFGAIDAQNFYWPTSRKQALAILDFFCLEQLPHFGTYQDAMHTDEWYLFHSRLSFAMNSKLLHPLEVVKKSIETFRENPEIDIAQIEGFVRQIIGWREYMRGIYWKFMPEYALKNELENYNPLPDFYWTGNTKMNCLKQSIGQSLKHAYAHHIQRLMITGNFALLTQCNPTEVDAWYLGVYIDAIEWVEITNTRGMSQYADGGIVATKPYISSANYIKKMSNYCDGCQYNHKEKTTENACPFNSLYWNFLDDKKHHFENNNRMGMMLNLLKKIPSEDLKKIKQKAKHIIAHIEEY